VSLYRCCCLFRINFGWSFLTILFVLGDALELDCVGFIALCLTGFIFLEMLKNDGSPKSFYSSSDIILVL
jgi:hypothetical protein